MTKQADSQSTNDAYSYSFCVIQHHLHSLLFYVQGPRTYVTIHEHIYADGEHRFQDVEYKKLGVENIFGSAY